MFEHGEADYKEYPYERAQAAIARARQTEGVTESGLWRTAVVESAAALTEAIFDLSSSVQGILHDPESVQDIAYKLGDVAEAIEKVSKALPGTE